MDEDLVVVKTDRYALISAGSDAYLTPTIQSTQLANFTGGMFVHDEKEFIIHSVFFEAGEAYPTFKLHRGGKKLEANTDKIFMAVENMQNLSSWESGQPSDFRVELANDWPIHHETILNYDDGERVETLEKSRGIWDQAIITKEWETIKDKDGNETSVFLGLYKVALDNEKLDYHPQHNNPKEKVRWYGGTLRMHRAENLSKPEPIGERDTLKVVKIEGVGSGLPIAVYFREEVELAPDKEILLDDELKVNFYPGYIAYLYADQALNLTEGNIMPEANQGVHYSAFGIRSIATDCNGSEIYSPISVPALMFAKEIILPQIPELPTGAAYASKPNAFGKSSYAFKVKFVHNPYAVLFYRADEQLILNALYNQDTVRQIKNRLEEFGPQNLSVPTDGKICSVWILHTTMRSDRQMVILDFIHQSPKMVIAFPILTILIYLQGKD